MSMIQIRDVPEAVHRALKIRAVQAGMTLSDFLLAEISAVAERPTPAELVDRIRRRGTAARLDSVSAVRAERAGRR